ncbi:uncharacterized protein LOC105695840 isoform X2 [Orussus abietinus]|uniref:uncharacterized protein LOC105695840 isoform X2 n=1 Tax=Orussus abietinus TaxID=222816 RepID=UPI00062527F7|nr:uncharacterized protein LOC105695840 isoform X2 [Orussus abietinus]
MAGVLKSCTVRNDEFYISFLIVAKGDLCEKIAESLHENAKERNRRVAVHQCESVTEVLQARPNLGVDFIIFAFDCRVRHALSQLEEAILQVDDHFILTGCACLVDCSSEPSAMGQRFHEWQLRNNYNLYIFPVKVSDSKDCIELGNRIINVAETKLGLSSGIPLLDSIHRYE